MKKINLLIVWMALMTAVQVLYGQDAAKDTESEFETIETLNNVSFDITFAFTNLTINDDIDYSFSKGVLYLTNTKDKSWGTYVLKPSNGRKMEISDKQMFVIDVVLVAERNPDLLPAVLKKKFRIAFPDYWMNIADEFLVMDENNKVLFSMPLVSED